MHIQPRRAHINYDCTTLEDYNAEACDLAEVADQFNFDRHVNVEDENSMDEYHDFDCVWSM